MNVALSAEGGKHNVVGMKHELHEKLGRGQESRIDFEA
jgi:hypothetical protein